MTVKELKEALEKCSDDAKVLLEVNDVNVWAAWLEDVIEYSDHSTVRLEGSS